MAIDFESGGDRCVEVPNTPGGTGSEIPMGSATTSHLVRHPDPRRAGAYSLFINTAGRPRANPERRTSPRPAGGVLQTEQQTTNDHLMAAVLESLERMLDVYREKCLTQSAEIDRLKQAMEDTMIPSVRAPVAAKTPLSSRAPVAAKTPPSSQSTTVAHAPTGALDTSLPFCSHASRLYIDEIAEELEAVLEKNEQLERAVARLQRRLDVEEEWREAAMEFMEIDTRIHKIVGVDGGGKRKKKLKGSLSAASASLREALIKTRCLEKSLRKAL